MPWVYQPDVGRRRASRRRQRSFQRSARRYGGGAYLRRSYGEYDDFGDQMDDDFDGDAYADGGPTRISVVDQRGRPVAVSIQGQNIRDMQPPYEDRGIYANTRRRSRF